MTWTADPTTPPDVRAMTTAVAADLPVMSERELVEEIRGLEELVCAAQARQAALSAALDVSVREAAAALGIPKERQGRGVAHQVALARRESPHRGERHLQLARIAGELPYGFAAWRAGRISEWTVTVLARETACLTREHRLAIDADLAEHPATIEAMGVGELLGEVRRRAYALDPASFVARRARAEADRHTSLRPAPDTMAIFSALLTVKQGVAVHAVLTSAADRARAAGDPRTRGQVMADTLVDRVLAPASTEGSAQDAAPTSPVSLMVNIVVPDKVLLGDEHGDGAAWVEGYGPVPGELIRSWIAEDLEGDVAVFYRRLYARPGTGELVAMDSTAGQFPTKLAEFLRARHQRCRTPWCDAPIRHADHITARAQGGPTTAVNGQGLCEACNYAKQAHGWTARPRPGPGRHTVETVTPTGHTYTTTAPDLTAGRPLPRLDIVWAPAA